MNKKQNKIKKTKLFLIFFLVIILLGCEKKEKKIEDQKFLFGTYIRIVIYSKDEAKARKSIDLAFEKIEEIDEKYNSKNKDSFIYKINNSKEKEIEVDEDFKFILENVKKLYVESGKKYDITISPLLDLWGFGTDKKEVPKESEIKEVLKEIGFPNVIIEGNKLKYLNNLKNIDTGSFLKGYAISKGIELLRSRGEERVFITSISSIGTIGEKPDKKPWRVGIQDPFNLEEMLGVVELSNEALGVSGDYQTYIEINGKKYHHILDIDTGYPVRDKKLVAVISSSSFLADMYSTALFLMPEKEILKFAKEKNIEVLVVKSDGNLIKTNNFELK